MADEDVTVVGPQPGPQMAFLASSADIAIIGGSVFGGKTWALCWEMLRHIDVPGFTFAAFRRVAPALTNPGGIWDESLKWFPEFGGESKSHVLQWHFPSGAWGRFAGLQYDTSVLDWKSAQLALICFDQLEEFTEKQFWYMLSRNRSTCGVRPYIRATVNPDPDSFLAEFLSWWIDQDSGYAIPERSGVLRYFARDKETLHWADSREQLIPLVGEARARRAKSVTFILARLQDNAIGNAKDPDYLATMEAMPYVEQERLLGGDRGGNWKIRASAGLVFNRANLPIVDATPATVRVRVRGWDKAASPGKGDWTAGVRLSIAPDGIIYIEDVVRGRWNSGDREAVHRQVAEIDTARTLIHLEQEPGSGGKDSAAASIKNLAGFTVTAATSTGDKVARAGPIAAQAKAGNVRLVRGPWNEAYLRELEAFPTTGVPDDQVDATSGAYNHAALGGKGFTQVDVIYSG